MRKVRSYFYVKYTRAAYKTTISNLSFTVLYAVAYILYLALEEGSPLYSNKLYSFYLFNLSVDSISTNLVILILLILLQYIINPLSGLIIYSDINIGCSIFIHTNHRISFDFFS